MKACNLPLKIFILLTVTTFSISSFASSKYKICSASLNSKNEENKFREYIANNPDEKLEMVNLIEEYDPAITGKPVDSKASGAWFNNICNNIDRNGSPTKPIKCDILLISAHAAEDYFGPRTGLTLSLAEMEKRSCQKSCDGLLKHPKKVFLMGCNTLADKKPKGSINNYINRLMSNSISNYSGEKISYDDAERVAMAVYGPFGQSIKNRARSVFSGTSQLEGYGNVAPTGEQVEDQVQEYLMKIREHGGIENDLNMRNQIDLNDLINRANHAVSRMRDPISEDIFNPGGNSGFTQCSGLNPSDAEYEVKRNICKLHAQDKNGRDTPLNQRLKHGLDLLEDPNYKKYVPSVTKFIKDNYRRLNSDPRSRKILAEMSKSTNLEGLLNNILKSLRENGDKSLPANQLDVMITQKLLGHLSDSQLETRTKELLSDEFKSIDGSNHGLLCTLKDAGVLTMSADSGMFESSQLATPSGVRAMGCFKTDDSKITTYAMQAINKARTPTELTYTLMGLSDLPKTKAQKSKINSFASGLINNPDPKVANPAHRLILRTGSDKEVQASMTSLLSSNRNTNYVTNYLIENPDFKDSPGSEQISNFTLQLLTEEQKKSPKPSRYALNLAKSFVHLTPNDSSQWDTFKQTNSNSISVNQFILREAAKLKINNTHLTDVAIGLTKIDVDMAQKKQGYYSTGHTSYLHNAKLSEKQYDKLVSSYNSLSEVPKNKGREHWRLQLYRSILKKQNYNKVTFDSNAPSGNIVCKTINTYQTLCE